MKLTKPLLALTAATCLAYGSFGHDDHAALGESHAKPLDFIENKGQWDAEAKFKASVGGGAFFLTDHGFVYNYTSQEDLSRIHELWHEEGKRVSGETVHYHAYKVNFVGANTSGVSYESTEKRSNYQNYFIGNDQSKWAGNVGLYGQVVQKNIYNGIDVSVYSKGQSLKYDFVVAPGADPSQIVLAFEGVTPQLTAEGNLRIRTTVNEVVEKAPYTYQVVDGRQVLVKSKFALNNGQLTFEFADGYNKQLPLIIDPELVFATYSGGNQGNNYSYTTGYDADGNLYAAADAWNTGWPVTTGAFQSTYAGGSHEAAINKYSSDGTTLIYSTYFGGSNEDYPHAMRVNPNGELVLVGSTNSDNLPVSAGCYDNALAGNWDMFIVHFNSTATGIIGATYMGGSGVEPQQFTFTGTNLIDLNNGSVSSPLDLVFDATGNIWIIGNTTSTDFPTSAGAAQPTLSGAIDGFLIKMNPDLTQLLYGSYMGGSGNDGPTALGFNNAGNLVVCGITSSTNFPTTSGTISPTAPGGTFDGFVSILNPTTGGILQSTYLGTTNTDQAVNLQIDCADNIYILGRTIGNYPVSPGVWSTNNNGDVFIDKINSTLSSSTLSTRIGNPQSSGRYFPSAFLVDVCGNIYVGGFSAIAGLPVTPDAFQSSAASFWLVTLEPNFNNIIYGSYFGVSGDHNHIGVNRLDPDGFVYHSICNYTPYPYTTPTAYSPTKQASGQDMLSFKFNFEANPIKIKETSSAGGLDTATHCIRGCKSAFVEISRLAVDPEPLTVKFTRTGTAISNSDYQILVNGIINTSDSVVIPSNQLSTILEVKPLLVPAATGVREAIINVLSPCGCDGGGDQIVDQATVKIYDSLYVAILTPFDTVCPNTPITIEAEIDSTLTYHWSPAIYDQGSLIINPSPIATSRYSITVTQPGAPATCPPRTATYEAFVEPVPHITLPVKDITICAGDSLDINVYAQPDGTDYRYQWSPPDYLRDDFSPNNKFNGPIGDYKKVIRVSTPVAGCESFDSMYIHVVPPFQFSWVAPVDTTIKYGDQIQLDSESDAIMWLWTPVTYLSDPLAKQPYATPLEDITYQVIGIDQYGCKDTAEVHINVEFQSMANIPNAFTPNGDGHNDVFKIMNREFEKMTEFRVFNRYGQVVFETIDPEKGWDGTIDGKPASSDVYHYIIRLVMPGGIDKVYKGDLTLLR